MTAAAITGTCDAHGAHGRFTPDGWFTHDDGHRCDSTVAPGNAAVETMLGDRVFVLALLIHAFVDHTDLDVDASLDGAFGSGKAWSDLDFGQSRKYRVTIEDLP